MAFTAKTDYLGLAKTGLEIVANSSNASNQNLEIVGANGTIVANEVFGSVKAPHCDYKITGDIATFNTWKLGKVHATGTGAKPYALRGVQIHTGAGDEPTLGADGVEIQAGGTQTKCTFTLSIPALSPARHALTFGAFTYTESATLALQSSDFTAECEIDPVTINGVPKVADAIKAYQQVSVTMWSTTDATPPSVTVASGWKQTADWSCTGADGQLFTWTATFRKYLTAD